MQMEMILIESEEQASFYQQLKSLYEQQKTEDPLSLLRAKGWDHFTELGLPSKKAEVFQYIRLNKLYTKPLVLGTLKPSLVSHILPECEKSYIVFVNGELKLSLSNITRLPQNVVAIPLKEALRSFGSFINNQVARTLQEEVDPFAALNAAFIQNALFFYLPPNTILKNPLQIIQIIEGENQLICPRVEFFFGALSQAEVVTTVVHGVGGDNFINSVTNFSLEDGAEIGFSRAYLHQNTRNWHFDATRAVLKKDSTLTSVIAENGSECYRDDYKISLVGSNADVHLNGVGMLDGKEHSHTHVLVDHQAPNCTSLQIFKNAVNGVSKSSFEGKIYVHKIAQKTQAFQLNNNLILNEGAESTSKPNLEIFADDVKASHGATFGSLDQEQLFYFLTRGIEKNQAKRMLVHGFCAEIIEKFKVPSLLRLATEWIKEYG